MGIHTLLNGTRQGPDQAALQDKATFATRAAAAGLPSVPTLAVLTETTAIDPGQLAALHPDGVFLKCRSGYNAISAFCLWAEAGTVKGRMFDGRVLATEADIQAAYAELCARDHAIVQPFLREHPLLAAATTHEDTVTISVATHRRPTTGAVVLSYVRVAVAVSDGHGKTTKRAVRVIIDPETGKIGSNPNAEINLLPQGRLLETQVLRALGPDARVPYWNEIREHSHVAQMEFETLWGNTWDWIVTADGPFLLEGNVYWGMGYPQEIVGGLVPTMLESTRHGE